MKWGRFVALALVGLLVLNGFAFWQSYRFTHPVRDAKWTEKPEHLGLVEKVRVLLTGVTIPRTANRVTPSGIGHDFRSITIHGQDGIDTPIWEIVVPDARCTVLMFHGYASHRDALLPLAAFLLDQDCNIVLADFPGHGDSPEDWTSVGDREAGVVRDVFAYYRPTAVQPVLLYGQSLGASSILGAVGRYGVAPDALILEMPYGSLLDTVRRRFDLMGFPISFPFAEVLVLWGGLQFGSNGFALNPVEYARDVTMPALLLGGGDDYEVSPDTLDQIRRNMAGSVQSHTFPSRGHERLFAAAPGEYQQALGEFLASVLSEGRP